MRRGIILTFMLFLFFTANAVAEMVFLKDGGILEGKIISDEADHLVLKKKDGKNLHIKRNTILRLLYLNLSLTKIYVQKRDGQNFVAYLVDEDRDEYRFRKELYQPAEFTVARKDVLFMSEKNPSALKGEPSSDSVSLSWLPPYGQVKVYKIYMKLKKNDEYKVAATTSKKEFILSGLNTQTTYFFYIRAVDDTDYETSPSNEIQVLTKSFLPEAPRVKAVQDENRSWNLSWDQASDSDGKVEKYRIYIEKEGKYSLYKQTEGLSAIIPADTVYDTIHVRSVDNNGDESEAADYRNDWRFQLLPKYWVPVSKMSEFAGPGFGAGLDVSRRDVFFNDFELGLAAGCVSLEGKKRIGEGNSNVTTLYMFPAALFCGYRIPLRFDRFGHYDIISLMPKVSAGVMSAYSDYELLDNSGAVEEKKSSFMITPFVSAGMHVEFGISRNFFFTIGSEILYLIDKTQGLGIINVSASAGFRY